MTFKRKHLIENKNKTINAFHRYEIVTYNLIIIENQKITDNKTKVKSHKPITNSLQT